MMSLQVLKPTLMMKIILLTLVDLLFLPYRISSPLNPSSNQVMPSVFLLLKLLYRYILLMIMMTFLLIWLLRFWIWGPWSHFGSSSANSASALKIGDNPLNLDHNGKLLPHKIALQGLNVANWVAANSTEFHRLIQKTKLCISLCTINYHLIANMMYPTTILPPKIKLSMMYVSFEFEE